MKINVKEIIKDYDGKEMKSESNAFTIRGLISAALNTHLEDEKFSAENKAKAYYLSNKVWGSDEVDLDLGERAFIKERAGKVLFPLYFGRLSEVLEESKEDKPRND